MPVTVQIRIHPSLYIRDPEATELGKSIVSASVVLIDQIGFEEFTFNKLAKKIKSTEASVYRYFENKNQLLAYLVSWYWLWVQYLIEYRIMNITDPRKQLDIALAVLVDSAKYDPAIPHIDESILHRVTIDHGARVYMTKHSKGKKYSGLFDGYEGLCSRLLSIVQTIAPKYKFANELITTLIAAVHTQAIYMEVAAHAMKGELSRVKGGRTEEFLRHLVMTSLEA